MSQARVRRFAPLKQSAEANGTDIKPLRGIIFDMDGTLSAELMFGEMRAALGIEKPTDILDHIYSLPDEEQEVAMEKIRTIERQAMTLQKPQAGLVTLMAYIESKSIPKAICTRNFDGPVQHLLEKHLTAHHFHPIVTRDFRPPKPDPAGIFHIASQWGLDGATDVIMVGDSLDDLTAGYKAGAATVLLMNETNSFLADHEHTDLVIKRLDELIDILDNGFPGRIES